MTRGDRESENRATMSDKTCKAPDPNTRVPSHRVPPGACDAHCQGFGPTDRFPYAPDRAHTPPEALVAEWRRVHRTVGVERAIIVQAGCHGTDNRAMLDAIASSGGAYRGVTIVGGT